MSVSASSGYSDPNSFVPTFSSENAKSASEEKTKDAKHLSLFAESDSEPSFWDLVDVINPLQHIPVVNTIYQELTGDKIGVGARLAGGTLFGGPVGLIASAIGCIVEEETGDDVGGHVMALFRDTPSETPPQTAAAPEPQKPDPTLSATAPQASLAQAAPLQPAPAQTSGAPLIELPQGDVSTLAKQNTASNTMVFNTDGMVEQPVQLAAVQPAATHAAGEKQPMPLVQGNAQARFMPVPPRTATLSDKTPPPVSVPISSGSNRSNVPITGRDPLVGKLPDPSAVQKAAAQQNLPTGTQHPMLGNVVAAQAGVGPALSAQNAGAQGMQAAQAIVPSTGGTPDWFQSMNQALDKYQKAGNLASRSSDAAALPLQ